jgi:hypothetical protein
MSSVQTPGDFSSALADNFNWRLKELSGLKTAIASAKPTDKRGLTRALVVMCYAHWEGHAKYCADLFVRFLCIRRLRFSELSPHFYELRFAREVGPSMSVIQKMELVEKIRTSDNERMSHFPRDIIDTRSNLNSGVLTEFCAACGLDVALFEPEFDFLDRILLRRRNDIAHGQDSIADAIDVDDLVKRTLKLMRLFRDQVDNSVALSAYKAAA